MVLKPGGFYCIIIQEFENDVNMYGTQAGRRAAALEERFENDVNMYGTQAYALLHSRTSSLRMM